MAIIELFIFFGEVISGLFNRKGKPKAAEAETGAPPKWMGPR